MTLSFRKQSLRHQVFHIAMCTSSRAIWSILRGHILNIALILEDAINIVKRTSRMNWYRSQSVVWSLIMRCSSFARQEKTAIK